MSSELWIEFFGGFLFSGNYAGNSKPPGGRWVEILISTYFRDVFDLPDQLKADFGPQIRGGLVNLNAG